MYREFENKEDIIKFALGVMCYNLREELGDGNKEEYEKKLQTMSVDRVCKEADWLYYLSNI